MNKRLGNSLFLTKAKKKQKKAYNSRNSMNQNALFLSQGKFGLHKAHFRRKLRLIQIEDTPILKLYYRGYQYFLTVYSCTVYSITVHCTTVRNTEGIHVL